MELNKLIENTLFELEEAKKDPNKKKYLVDEVTIETEVTIDSSIQGRAKLMVVSGGMSSNDSRTQKIIIKLRPKPNK